MRYATLEAVTFSQIPCWAHLSPKRYRARIAELVKLPANPTERQIRHAVIQANFELQRIEEKLAAAPAAPPGASREARPPESGTRPPAAPPAPAPRAAAPAPPKKPTPPTPVGSRGNPNRQKLENMSAEQVRDMDLDEFRRRRESGEGA